MNVHDSLNRTPKLNPKTHLLLHNSSNS